MQKKKTCLPSDHHPSSPTQQGGRHRTRCLFPIPPPPHLNAICGDCVTLVCDKLANLENWLQNNSRHLSQFPPPRSKTNANLGEPMWGDTGVRGSEKNTDLHKFSKQSKALALYRKRQKGGKVRCTFIIWSVFSARR